MLKPTLVALLVIGAYCRKYAAHLFGYGIGRIWRHASIDCSLASHSWILVNPERTSWILPVKSDATN
jgi:hypothetical protein